LLIIQQTIFPNTTMVLIAYGSGTDRDYQNLFVRQKNNPFVSWAADQGIVASPAIKHKK